MQEANKRLASKAAVNNELDLGVKNKKNLAGTKRPKDVPLWPYFGFLNYVTLGF